MRTLRVPLETPALVVGGAAYGAFVAYVLVEMGTTAAFAVAALPAIAMGGVYLMTSGQIALWAAAFILPISEFLLGRGIGPLFYQDIVVLVALGAIIFATFIARGRVPGIPYTPVVRWPLVFFAAAIFSAVLRGHDTYGASLIGQPVRLFLYAAIVASLAGMTVDRVYRVLPLVLYPAVVVLGLRVAFFLATGGSGQDAFQLSTGGTRILGISASMYASGALFLALLKLRLAGDTRGRMLHLVVVVISTFCVAASFGRAVYAAVAIVGLLFFVTSREIRSRVLSVVPLALPFLVILAIAAHNVAPDFIRSVNDRMFSDVQTDANVQWRLEANRAVLEQVRENPLFGVGFGRTSEFFLEVESETTGLPSLRTVEIGQDPHNGYMLLLAGGGIFALGTFVLLLGVFAFDAARRYRANADPRARLIVLWASATLFVFLLNGASAPVFGKPDYVLAIWALLVLPAVVRASDAGSRGGTEADEREGDHSSSEAAARANVTAGAGAI